MKRKGESLKAQGLSNTLDQTLGLIELRGARVLGQSRSRPEERRGWRERAPAPRDHQRVIASTKHQRAPHQPRRGRAAKATTRAILEAWRGDNRQSPYSIGDSQAPRAQHLPQRGARSGGICQRHLDLEAWTLRPSWDQEGKLSRTDALRAQAQHDCKSELG